MNPLFYIKTSTLHNTSLACLTLATLWLGRKVCIGAASKVTALAAEFLGKNELAFNLNKKGDEHLDQARQNAVNDLTIAGLITIGLVAGYCNTTIKDAQLQYLYQKNQEIDSQCQKTQFFSVLAVSFLLGLPFGLASPEIMQKARSICKF